MNNENKFSLIRDRVELYKDFSINLLHYIFKYYVDRDSLSEDEDIRNHFNWCYNKVCDEFMLENINFSCNKELREYYFTYYYHQFYIADNNESIPIEYYQKFWLNIFDVDKQKNKNIIKILVELYQIFDKSINHKKKITKVM